ncbi:MAG: DUF1491 family protein [Pseudomonadota bacterium]
MPRLKTGIVVSALRQGYERRAIPCVVMKRGADEGGSIYLEVDRLDGRIDVYSPAPSDDPDTRAWMALYPDGCDALKASAYFARIREDDPDAWILSIEDRECRHGLDPVIDL